MLGLTHKGFYLIGLSEARKEQVHMTLIQLVRGPHWRNTVVPTGVKAEQEQSCCYGHAHT